MSGTFTLNSPAQWLWNFPRGLPPVRCSGMVLNNPTEAFRNISNVFRMGRVSPMLDT